MVTCAVSVLQLDEWAHVREGVGETRLRAQRAQHVVHQLLTSLDDGKAQCVVGSTGLIRQKRAVWIVLDRMHDRRVVAKPYAGIDEIRAGMSTEHQRKGHNSPICTVQYSSTAS